MTDVELRLTADLDQATKEVAGFRKEYQDMVRAVEKPLRQVNIARDLERDLEATGKAVRGAKDQLRALQSELINTDRPSERLKTQYRDMASELQRLERVEARQQTQLSRMRGELTGAGIDTSRLAQEQRRLNAELTAGLAAGRNDAAVAGIRARSAALAQVAREQRAANLEAAKADLGVNRYRVLQSELTKLRGQYQLLRTSGNLTNQELAVAQSNLTRRIRETNQALRETASAQSGTAGGLGGAVGGLLGGFGLLEGARAYVNATDLAKKMEAQLRLATESQEEFNRAQAETYRIAQENQAPLEDVVTLYSRLTPALREVGRGQGDALKIIEAVTKSLRISGATAQETASTIQQFSQALGSGVLRGEEFNTLAESSPRLLRALADGLNTNVGALRQMAADGALTASVISDALIGQLPKLTEEAAQLPETFSGASIKFKNDLVAAITVLDRFTGASNSAIGSLTRFSGALRTAAEVKAPSWLDRFGETFRLLGNTEFQSKAFSWLLFGFDGVKEEAEQVVEVVEDVQGQREKDVQSHVEYLAKLDTLRKSQIKAAQDGAKALVAAEKKATADLQKARDDRLKIEQRYQEALAGLGGTGEASYSSAQNLKIGARNALANGDVEGAQRMAQQALKMLQDLAAAGENQYGFRGFIQELQQIELAANDLEQSNAEDKLASIRDEMQQLKDKAKELEGLPVSVKTDDATIEQVRTTIESLVQQLSQNEVVIPVRVLMPDQVGTVSTEPSTNTPALATGGILRGPGTGTSDSILARLSNGEGVINARAVQYYGADLIHQLNNLRTPRFATGGVMGNVPVPSIPTLSPALQQQLDGPVFPELGSVDFNMPGGESFTVYVPQSEAARLRRLSLKFRGTGRKG